MVASLRGDSSRARTLAQAALAALPADDTDWRAFLLLQSTYLAHFTGDLAGAQHRATEGGVLATVAGNHHLAATFLAQQAHILHDRGHLTAAEAHLKRARATVEHLGAQGLEEASVLDLVAALVSYERDDLVAATRLVDQWQASATAQRRALHTFLAGVIRARLLVARGAINGAYGALDAAEYNYRQVAPTDGARAAWTAQVVPAWRARLDAARGDLSAVRAWADTAARVDLTAAPFAYWAHSPIPAMLARAALLAGEPARALMLLAELRDRAEAGGAGRALLEIITLQALALEALGRPAEATAELSRALRLAALKGARRVFLDEGAPLVALVQRVAAGDAAGATNAPALLAAFGIDEAALPSALVSRPGTALAEPLTAREQDVLVLTATGLATSAIAEHLSLSVSTVKWHLRSIYGKLGAARRTDAVARARAFGLLD
ncbi:MAG: hypothetical protein IT340_05620 [Chloroflexi bacterium]|nr:hypothetical protein [Chloroflexota bacterium]